MDRLYVKIELLVGEDSESAKEKYGLMWEAVPRFEKESAEKGRKYILDMLKRYQKIIEKINQMSI